MLPTGRIIDPRTNEEQNMSFDEGRVHEGHRGRMKAKLAEHGGRIFDTYELLEMLLYYVIPYKDTNPIAKRLLAEFGSLDGVFAASREELIRVPGIGERCADFLIAVARSPEMRELSSTMRPNTLFDSFTGAGKFFVNYFAEEREASIAVMLLDDRMRLLGVKNIPGSNFGSGSVHSKCFIDHALRLGATTAIIGYTHRNGIAYPYEGDLVTGRMVRDEMAEVGVTVVEQFVIGANGYMSALSTSSLRTPATPAMKKFYESRREALENV